VCGTHDAWQHWATRDTQKITEYWREHPDSNVSVLDSKFGDGTEAVILLDTDVRPAMDGKPAKDGEAVLTRLEQEHGALPTTYTEKTPTGGSSSSLGVLSIGRAG
jgi:hypothetical protein